MAQHPVYAVVTLKDDAPGGVTAENTMFKFTGFDLRNNIPQVAPIDASDDEHTFMCKIDSNCKLIKNQHVSAQIKGLAVFDRSMQNQPKHLYNYSTSKQFEFLLNNGI